MTDYPIEPGVSRRRPPAAGSFTRSFLGAFARGTGLVAVALVLGIVLLQWSDASTDVAAGGQPPPAGTPVGPAETSTTTASTAPPGPRAPGDLAVLVLNGSGKNQQAGPMSERLKVVGYRTLTPGNASRRPDSVVLCRPGLDQEATALVVATGIPATAGILDEAAAAGMEGAAEADCVVIIGSG
ncbi:MAG: LytR C-terminal domain-containing protein [Actinomycetota bacterium]